MKTETKTFDEWMRQVDQEIQRTVGVSSLDLTDQPYMDWYMDGVKSGRAAARALADNGF